MEDRWNEYLDNEYVLLKNHFGLHGEADRDKLNQIERNISLEKLTLLYFEPIIGSLDANHLKRIHQFLFDEIYPFAGKYREVDMEKEHFVFRTYKTIPTRIEATLKQMQEEIKNVNSVYAYSYFLATFYNELNVIHPFREGNGRTIREFLREFVLQMNSKTPFEDVELDFSKVDKDNLLLGTKERYLYPSYLEMEFMKALVPLEKNEETYKKR